mmetsp:Transcript_18611/g.45931  ORF Transcript_18611/g.45931 Transcript_18611/m.45931 type:complete len:81 (+) Transcript_18611:65-307(+)
MPRQNAGAVLLAGIGAQRNLVDEASSAAASWRRAPQCTRLARATPPKEARATNEEHAWRATAAEARRGRPPAGGSRGKHA